MRTFPKSELVAAVYHRLAEPKNWAKSTAARDRWGRITHPNAPDAVAWCLTGAMDHELHLRGYARDHITYGLHHDIAAVFKEQYPELKPPYGSTVQGFNDHPLMTYEGMRMVLNKVYVKLIERGE